MDSQSKNNDTLKQRICLMQAKRIIKAEREANKIHLGKKKGKRFSLKIINSL